MTIDIGTERLREVLAEQEAWANEAAADLADDIVSGAPEQIVEASGRRRQRHGDIATALRALIAARELAEKWRGDAKEEAGHTPGFRIAIKAAADDLAAIIGSKP